VGLSAARDSGIGTLGARATGTQKIEKESRNVCVEWVQTSFG